MLYPKDFTHVLSNYKDLPINLDDSPSEKAAAASFIERCLTLEPDDRPSAAELLRHPWLLSGHDQTAVNKALKRLELI